MKRIVAMYGPGAEGLIKSLGEEVTTTEDGKTICRIMDEKGRIYEIVQNNRSNIDMLFLSNIHIICISVFTRSYYESYFSDYRFDIKSPKFLVSTEVDLKNDEETIQKLKEKSEDFHTQEEIEEITRQVGATSFIEYSEKTKQGVKELKEALFNAEIIYDLYSDVELYQCKEQIESFMKKIFHDSVKMIDEEDEDLKAETLEKQPEIKKTMEEAFKKLKSFDKTEFSERKKIIEELENQEARFYKEYQNFQEILKFQFSSENINTEEFQKVLENEIKNDKDTVSRILDQLKKDKVFEQFKPIKSLLGACQSLTMFRYLCNEGLNEVNNQTVYLILKGDSEEKEEILTECFKMGANPNGVYEIKEDDEIKTVSFVEIAEEQDLGNFIKTQIKIKKEHDQKQKSQNSEKEAQILKNEINSIKQDMTLVKSDLKSLHEKMDIILSLLKK